MKLVKMSIAAVVTALLAGCSGSMVVPMQDHASILSNAERNQLNAHIKKLEDYTRNPLGSDNKGVLGGALGQGNDELAKKIYEGRIQSLKKQIENFRKQLQECEKKYGR